MNSFKDKFKFADLEKITNMLNCIKDFRLKFYIKDKSSDDFIDYITTKLKQYAIKNKNYSLKTLHYKKIKESLKDFNLQIEDFR